MDALLTVVVISLLMVLVYGPWQALCTARARQAMFERRDAIFDIAAGGRLDFDSESYRVLRKSLEGQIRYAHILTIPRFFFLFTLSPAVKRNKAPSIKEAVAKIKDVETRREVNRHVHKAQLSIIGMMIAKSPMTLIIVALMLPFVVISYLFSRRTTKRFLDRKMEVVANRVEEEAASGGAFPYALAA